MDTRSPVAARYFDTAQAAEYLMTTPHWIRSKARDGSLPFYRLPGGKFVRFKVEDLDAFVESGRGQAMHR